MLDAVTQYLRLTLSQPTLKHVTLVLCSFNIIRWHSSLFGVSQSESLTSDLVIHNNMYKYKNKLKNEVGMVGQKKYTEIYKDNHIHYTSRFSRLRCMHLLMSTS